MKKLFIIGDIQINYKLQWSQELNQKIVDYFTNFDFGPREDTFIIQLGDVVENALNSGDSVLAVHKIFSVLSEKANKIFIVQGNHDVKLVHNKLHVAFEFLSQFGNIEMVTKESIINIAGTWETLFLPYQKIQGQSLEDYYDSIAGNYTQTFDLICGHVSIKEPKSWYGGINLDLFRYNHSAFGHIHTRSGKYKKDYTGSVVPLKVNEDQTDLPRCIKVIDEKKNYSEINLPTLVEFKSVAFPEPLLIKKNSDIINIYTILNCRNLHEAQSYYGDDYYIKSVERKQSIENQSISTGEKQQLFTSKLEAFRMMIKETKLILKRTTSKYIAELLEAED